ncbi:LuxR family transcriptional regulator [Actinomadura darangshiensis]|uniref:LuxR family transcriptional regulator n=1 Tax=Actinomadura darangshiensis TaxID=705336 RepID=A0A4R5B6B9_9ACTN|nr:LuxR C-terminal-related transcriptional regulator [Actinomadura darangshiensis]TDD81401.1 LuxR family transcriptional regulator [Actinomadura darangshiensis]
MEEESLAAVLDVLRGPLDGVLPRMSAALAEVVPHEGMVLFTGDCLVRPVVLTCGLAEVSTDEVQRLVGQVGVGRPWTGRATLAGAERPVLAVAVKPPGTAIGFLAVALSGSGEPSETAGRIVRQLLEVVTVHVGDRVAVAEQPAESGPAPASVGDVTDAHAATLTALLGVLRAKRIDDATARRTAIELAVPALLEARSGGERVLDQEPAAEAFAVGAGMLGVLTRYQDIELELAAPGPRDRPLPGEVARAARAVVRAAVLAMLQQGGIKRIRLAWQVEDARLVVGVRDDGPGAVSPDTLWAHRLHDRVRELDGTLNVDPVANWGTTITAMLPLTPPAAPAAGPLDALNRRELDVLEQLTLGHRNRQIAQKLGISENTVKFHVANILGKLGVTSRGEAAALAQRRTPRRP